MRKGSGKCAEGMESYAPVADTEPGDTIRHLNDDKLAAAVHFARFALPDLVMMGQSTVNSALRTSDK